MLRRSFLAFAAGNGLTAQTDGSITNTLIGKAGGYTSPTNNWVGCFTGNFTAAAKSAATAVEWLVANDGAYARQAMGASGAGWTVNAYLSGTGVVWTNTNTITQPAVTLNAQTLGAIGLMDSVGPTGGNANFFIDVASPLSVAVGVNVILSGGGSPGLTFTTY